MSENKKDFHVGLVGAGIGGLTAAIAIARAGARVTVLESAEELGEVRPSILSPYGSRTVLSPSIFFLY
jgi:salicylate hydroxylase